MMPLLLAVTLLLASAVTGGADVYFVEQIVNPGFGAKKTGARKTTNKVYIKGKRQKVESDIETSAKTAKALREQGQSLSSSRILQLESSVQTRSAALRVDLDMDAAGQLEPAEFQVELAGQVRHPQLGAVELGGRVATDAERVRLDSLGIALLGGRLEARGEYYPEADSAYRSTLPDRGRNAHMVLLPHHVRNPDRGQLQSGAERLHRPRRGGREWLQNTE